LAHLINVAQSRDYTSFWLETGEVDAFKPAQKICESFDFVYCGPFGDYTLYPYSVFMRLDAKRAA
jgi:putative acetyltransferase